MKTSKRVLSVLLAVLLAAGCFALAATPVSALNVGDTIQFGSYPQTKVNETTALKNAADAATWESYNYYIGTGSFDGEMEQDTYMKYADFYSNGVKYRAVKFTQYRARRTSDTSSSDNSWQDDNRYSLNKVYYFKYEPLTWRVLDPSSGLILCEKIIDAQAYQNVVWENGNGSYNNINSTTYANNYSSSSIRKWLNGNNSKNAFYYTAFNDAQKAKIKSTTINNAAYSSSYSQYNSASTSDKIFLLSYSEVRNSSYGFSSDSSRKAYGTDYARCQGLYASTTDGAVFWHLRTAGSESYLSCQIASTGAVYADQYGSYSFTGRSVDYTESGIRPACKLTDLTSDTSQPDLHTITVSANPAAGGSVSGGGIYGLGEKITLTATAKYGYDFDSWYYYYNNRKWTVSENSTYMITVAEDREYYASFLPHYYTVTANAGTGGTVNLNGASSGSGRFAYSTGVTVEATPDPGYRFAGWYKGNTRVSTSATYSFTVTENVTLTANFEWITYTVTANAGAGGTASGSGTYGHGSNVVLTATPNSGYHFVCWNDGSGDVSTDAIYSFPAAGNVTLTAIFEQNAATSYTVTANASDGGTTAGGNTYDEGMTAVLTATPNEGYRFVGWFEGETLVNDSASYSFTVTKDVTLTAKFEKEADPTDPGTGTDDPTPSEPENVCPWCGGQHEGFFQGIIGFFHRIFAKLFGAKY